MSALSKTTPTFSYHGSKAVIAKKIISYFPRTCNRYAEPFAGRANVLFRILGDQLLTAQSYLLNDNKTAEWLETLRDYSGDWSFLPDFVDDDVFTKWQTAKPSIDRIMAEPIVCYHSNCYNINSASNSKPGSNFYSPNFAANWKRKLLMAQKILRRPEIKISRLDYRDFLNSIDWSKDDLIYLDPPYSSPYDEKRTYPKIDHKELLEIAVKLPCKIFISNYEDPLYEQILSLKEWSVEKFSRVSTAKGRQKGHSGGRTVKTECLWHN